MITVMVMTDGRRHYLDKAMVSLRDRVHGSIDRIVIHDDTGDHEHHVRLAVDYPDCPIIGRAERSGFCGAYQSAWQWLDGHATQPWVFQTEDDFTYETDIDLDQLVQVLTDHPQLLQLQLRRQPWWTEPEGGFIAQWPDLYTDAGDGTHHWLEHRRNWSTNPGLFSRSLCARPWPPPPGCEKTFGDQLLADHPDRAFAVWGQRNDPPVVWHIGQERIGHSY